MKDVWTMTAPKQSEKSFGKHPTQKPLELIERLISATTKVGGTVLDPFNGSGTTGVACINLDRKYFGIELEEEFIELSRRRFANAKETRKQMPF